MGRPTAAQRRVRSGVTVVLFSANATLGYVPIRDVSAEFALEQVALRRWREVIFNGELLGVQPLHAEEKKTSTHGRVPIAVTITLEEMKRYAGLYGPSRKPGDLTDLAVTKVDMWPYLRNTDPGLRVKVVDGLGDGNRFVQLENE